MDTANKLIVLYGSQSGTAETLAHNFQEDMEAFNGHVKVHPMDEFMTSFANEDKYKLFTGNPHGYKLVIICSTYGQGDSPDNAKSFYEYLQKNQDSDFSCLDFAVLALGSKNYPNFCQCGKDFYAMLSNAGAVPLLELICCDGDPDVDYQKWQQDLCHQLNGPLSVEERLLISTKNRENKIRIEKRECFVKGSVVETRHISPFIKELSIRVDEDYSYLPGQFSFIKVPGYKVNYRDFEIPETYRSHWENLGVLDCSIDNPKQIKRSYSFASAPSENKILKFNVRIALPQKSDRLGGIGSSYLFSLKAGDPVEMTPAQGDFLIQENNKEKVYIGGGAGMAPLRSHIVEQLHKGVLRNISLWYGARTMQELLYKDEFEKLARDFKNFTYSYALSDTPITQAGVGYRGFIHELVKTEFLSRHHQLYNVDFFLCGPPLMVEASQKMLRAMQVGDHQIFFDAF